MLLMFIGTIRHSKIKHQLRLRQPLTAQEAIDQLSFLVYAHETAEEESDIIGPLHKEIAIPPMRERQGQEDNVYQSYRVYQRPDVYAASSLDGIQEHQKPR